MTIKGNNIKGQNILGTLGLLMLMILGVLAQFFILWPDGSLKAHAVSFFLVFAASVILSFPLTNMKTLKKTVRELFYLASAACFYSSGIMLGFNLSVDRSLNLIFPTAMLLILCYLYNSYLCVLLFQITCMAMMFLTPSSEVRATFIILTLLLWMYARNIYKKAETFVIEAKLFELGTGLSGLLWLLLHEQRGAYGIWFLSVYTYLMILLFLHHTRYGQEESYYNSPLKAISVLFMILFWVHNASSDAFRVGGIPDADWNLSFVLLILLVVASAAFSENVLNGKASFELLCFIVAYLLSHLSYLYFEFYDPLEIGRLSEIFTAIVFIASGLGIFLGIKKRVFTLSATWVVILLAAAYYIFTERELLFAVILSAITIIAGLTLIHIYFKRKSIYEEVLRSNLKG